MTSRQTIRHVDGTADWREVAAMSLPFLLEIGTEEIPDWMIPGGARKPAPLCSRSCEDPARIASALDATPRRLVLRAEGLPARQPDSAKSASWVRRNRRPPQAVAGLRPQAGRRSPKTWRCESTPKGEYYTYLQKGAGPRHQRHPGRSAARRHPRPLLPQDHVLDRQGRSALHPSHPLDRRAAGRRSHSVRTRRRALRRPDQRPSPAGRARDRRHHVGLRTAPRASTS